ncbi:CRP-like cAMP-binding protein [Neorhizobium alkalisoli]|uniref:CRP-like cAMP-binding protein n=1 Tax=Neorhizobium alkalisoli TaxID=528178 RepID=A0A561QAZ4_9HYPH|nr:CRP-like cAMP-binding protein [Neorhizobium alkalisoli]
MGRAAARHLAWQVREADEHVYFLTDGIGSVLLTSPEGHNAEAGVFGHVGYIPSSAVSGIEYNIYDISVQIAGAAFRLPYERFRQLMETSRELSKVMIRAIEAFSIQLGYTALSNAVHDTNVLLARWLLMCHDRVSGDEIPLTHDFIAMMLAVRRPSVTTALHVLEGNRFIYAERGRITMRDRPALEDFASDAHGRPEPEWRRLMTDLAGKDFDLTRN